MKMKCLCDLLPFVTLTMLVIDTAPVAGSDHTLNAVKEHIMTTCDGQKSCDLTIPNWNAVNGTAEDCQTRFPDKLFHLRGVYLDVECELRKLEERKLQLFFKQKIVTSVG